MATWLSTSPFAPSTAPRRDETLVPRAGLAWAALPVSAQIFVTCVIILGVWALAMSLPLTIPEPGLFAILVLSSCLTSIWKVNLLIPLTSGSTLSVSYAANIMALLLLGPRYAVMAGVAGAWTQCTVQVKQPYPLYRTAFSTAAEAVTMVATSLVYTWLGGSQRPLDITTLPRPLVGAIATYFFVNTGLVAAAIALSSGRQVLKVWRDDFLWSGTSFFVAGSAGALAAIVIDRGDHWKAVLMLAPVYLTYQTYRVFVGRLEDQKRHVAETQQLHRETVDALVQATQAERALASEKERLAAALADMTRLKELRNQLLEREQAARSSAELANRLKDQFLAIVSHELRTPLNAILGWADMLRGGIITDETRRGRALHAIHDSAKRQAQIVDELLDLSRIISGKLRLERSAVNWQDIVNAALEVVHPAADAKRIGIAASVDPSIGAFYGDEARLQQIVWNLLTNAVKFTPDGGSVRVNLRRAHDRVELTVTDTGQGISPEFLPSVFEPFRQADGSTTRRHGGLGLGLSIVKHLVEAHGGTITAASKGDGRGATFTVRVPIVPVYPGGSASTEDPATPPVQAPPATSLAGTSVLVVDDDDPSREIVAEYLEVRNATVLTARSAAEALDLLERKHVDVLLADIAMPGRDGYELIRTVRRMRNAKASIPAAALTAFARAEDRQKAIEAGFQMHLTKPITLHTLIDAVARLSGKVDDETLTSPAGMWDVRTAAEPLTAAVSLNADLHRTRATDRRRP